MLRCALTNLLLAGSLLVAVELRAATPPDLAEAGALLAEIARADATPAQRDVAERRLAEATDVGVLALLYSKLDEPVPSTRRHWNGTAFESMLEKPTTIMETNPLWIAKDAIEQGASSVGMQIISSRHRLWEHLSRSVGDEPARAQALIAMRDQPGPDWAKTDVLMALSRILRPEADSAFKAVVADRTRSDLVRSAAANWLCNLSAVARRADGFEYVRDVAWQERGSTFAKRVAENLASFRQEDPKVTLLLLDVYESVRNQAGVVGAFERKRAASEIDRYLKTSLVPQPTAEAPRESAAWQSALEQRAAAWIAARKPALEARVAAQ